MREQPTLRIPLGVLGLLAALLAAAALERLDHGLHITYGQDDLVTYSPVTGENVASGMGTAAFVALLMGLCNHQFTATHYALLSALAAVGRIYVSPLSGVLSEAIGWPMFFVFSTLAALPGLILVWWMRRTIMALGAHR